MYTLAGCLHLYSVGEHRETQLEHDLHRDVENRLEVSILREIERIMKKDIHPDYHPVVFQDAGTGHQFLTKSTATSDRTVAWEDGNEYPLIVVDVTSESHPFWTGAQRVMDTAGRVEKFNQRYGALARRKKNK